MRGARLFYLTLVLKEMVNYLIHEEYDERPFVSIIYAAISFQLCVVVN